MGKLCKTEKNNKSKKPIFSIVSIIISLCALGVSICSSISNQESKPLSYYMKPTITSADNNTASVEIEAIVTNGSIGDVRILDYKDGEITEIVNYVGGIISEFSNKSQRTFKFELEIPKYNPSNGFIDTDYLLIHGKDGSKVLDMILYYVNFDSKEMGIGCYSLEDLVIAELDPNQQIFSNALTNYRELTTILKEKGEL